MYRPTKSAMLLLGCSPVPLNSIPKLEEEPQDTCRSLQRNYRVSVSEKFPTKMCLEDVGRAVSTSDQKVVSGMILYWEYSS